MRTQQRPGIIASKTWIWVGRAPNKFDGGASPNWCPFAQQTSARDVAHLSHVCFVVKGLGNTMADNLPGLPAPCLP